MKYLIEEIKSFYRHHKWGILLYLFYVGIVSVGFTSSYDEEYRNTFIFIYRQLFGILTVPLFVYFIYSFIRYLKTHNKKKKEKKD